MSEFEDETYEDNNEEEEYEEEEDQEKFELPPINFDENEENPKNKYIPCYPVPFQCQTAKTRA